MILIATNPAGASPQDEAAIATIVESVATLADRSDFDALEGLYADEVLVDYTSLTGGEPELKSPQGLMNDWAAVLPGFERTRHALTDIAVSVDGRRATATAGVTASHYLQDRFWQVGGNYRYELFREDDRWLIVAHTFVLEREAGTRDILNAAARRAAANPPPYVLRQQTLQAVRDFLTALEEKDMTKLAGVWAEDAVQDMPYSPPGHPKRVVGRANLIELYAAWPEVSRNADFTSELVFYPMLDPTSVFVEYKGRVDIVPTGREYRQTYGGLFHVENGRIALFREYYDPAPFVRAFGLDEE